MAKSICTLHIAPAILHLILCIFLLIISNSNSAFSQGTASVRSGRTCKSTLALIENKGQIIDQNNKPNPGVLYLLNTPGMNVQLRRGGFSYDVYSPRPCTPPPIGIGAGGRGALRSKDSARVIDYHRIDIDLVNSNPNPSIVPSDPAPDYYNYFTASAPYEGIKNVRQYAKITYKEIYPGIDLEFFTNKEYGYKYNFVVHPGAFVSDIKLKISGTDDIQLVRDFLIMMTSLGAIDELIPESYFLYSSSKNLVKSRFREIGKGVFGFSTDGNIPPGSTLVIDPTTKRLWGTYYGGSDWESEGQCSVDHSGNVFLAGATMSFNNIATAGAYQSSLAGNMDGFLVKFNAAGQRQWATYFGGDLHDDLGSCIVSNSGSIYVSGSTSSTWGMATTGAHQTVYGGGLLDCYIEKFDQNGTRIWGTYYGGAGSDSPGYLTIDKHGNIFLTGSTESDTGIATPGTYQPNRYGSGDAFLAKFNSNGVRQWGTYFGGEYDDIAYNGTTNSTGNVYIVGKTTSHTNIASVGAHQTIYGGWSDGFVAKFNTGGQRLWATYYGGSFYDYGLGCCTDDSGNVIVAGKTGSSTGIASTGSYQPLLGGYDDAFLVKFDSLGVRQWGTYYGGTGNEFAYSCATGRNNDIFMAGNTMSNDNISTPDAYQPALGGGVDGFVVKFNSAGVGQWGTYYGGADEDAFLKCSYSADDTLYLSGYTYSTTAIASLDGHQTIYGGARDDMLIKFVECWPIAAAGPITGPATVHRNSYGIQYSIPPLSHAVNYVWTLPPGATIAGGADTNCITVNFSGTATSGTMWVKGMNKCGPGDSAFLYITLLPEFFSVGFIVPDTTCINHTINITDTTTSGTTYYWNFCSGNTNTDPTGINIGNPGGLLSIPTYITLVKQNDSCFSFISCQGVGVIRYYHGTSFKNNPVSWTNLGNFGGVIGPSEEGIQVKFDNGNWYGFVNSNTTMIRLDFRSSPMNIPTATDIGPFPSFNMAHGLVITRDGTNWIGLVTCSTGQKLIRLNFGNSLANNSPVVTDFGNLGGVLISPAAICLLQETSLWYAMIMAGGNTLARISFGTSLLNAPTGVNLGNPGGFNSAGGLTLLRDCESTTGYWTNYLVNGELGKLTFPAGISGTVTGTLLGNIGGLAQPHSFSEIFRQSDTLYAYITNRFNGTLTRLTFLPCTNASVASSNLFSPPPFSYNQTGTYNIHLIVNEGLPIQGTVCKPIVIVNPPTVYLGADDSICAGGSKILNAGPGYSSYHWSTGATTQSITINAPGTYWVEAMKWGCTATDTIHITPALAPVITIAGNTMVFQGSTEVYTTQPGMTGYVWTFSAGGTWVSGGTTIDNTITIQWNSLGAQWVEVNYTFTNGCPGVLPTHLNVTVVPDRGFVIPDTTCVNHPVNIINTTAGGTTYYWTFCSGNATTNPLAANIGNPSNKLNHPMYMALAVDGNDHFSFVTNQGYPGYITRNYHGSSFSNDPSSSVNMLQAGELDHSVEAIQIVKNDDGNWYGFVNNNTTITRLDFFNSLWNTPTTTDLGPFTNISVAHGSAIIKEGNTWLGFFDSSPTANILSRLNFGTSLATIPTYENLGNAAGFTWPCQLTVVKENGLNYILVINYSPGSLSRVSFGNSLLNTPTGGNLGNCGAIISSTGITALNDCETSVGYYTVYMPVPNAAIGRLSFSGGIAGTVTATSLGNTGGFGRPDSFSQIFRQNDSLFAYVMNYDNSTLTRLSFPPCTNATPTSSTLFTPPPVSYNQPGTYNIRLIVDEGLLTETSVCGPIVVMDPPVVNLGNNDSVCPGGSKILNAGAGFSSYLWSTGATTQTITINSPGTYWVDAMKWGCMASDTV
ncbi:MAG: SBBP repeat-containing protein, partial [Bacteroidetes bacterium]|nr:SBBP repeat-containing protein [Bacteroidota bacterium]